MHNFLRQFTNRDINGDCRHFVKLHFTELFLHSVNYLKLLDVLELIFLKFQSPHFTRKQDKEDLSEFLMILNSIKEIIKSLYWSRLYLPRSLIFLDVEQLAKDLSALLLPRNTILDTHTQHVKQGWSILKRKNIDILDISTYRYIIDLSIS